MSALDGSRREVVAVATIGNVRTAGFPARPADGVNGMPEPESKLTRRDSPAAWTARLSQD